MSKRKERCPNCGSKKIIYGKQRSVKSVGFNGVENQNEKQLEKIRFDLDERARYIACATALKRGFMNVLILSLRHL